MNPIPLVFALCVFGIVMSVIDRNWSAALWALLAAWLAYLEMRRRHDVEKLLDRKRPPAP